MDSNKIVRICDDAIFCFACGLVYFLPISTALTEWGSGLIITAFFIKRMLLFFMQNQQNTSGLVKVSVFVRLRGFLKSFQPSGWYLNKPIGVFILLNLISVLISQYPALSWKGFVFKLLQGTLVFFGVVDGIKTRKQVGIFIAVFFVSAFLIGINGVYQAVHGTGFIQGREILQGRLRSSLKHANDFGGYLIVILPLVFSMFYFYFATRLRNSGSISFENIKFTKGILGVGVFFVLLFFILYACLGLTYSRGAWFGFFIALSLLGWFNRKAIIPLTLLAIAFGVIFFPRMHAVRNFVGGDTAEYRQAANIIDRSVKVFGAKIDSDMGRSVFWREALMVIRDFPAFGTGLNTYSKVGLHYKISWGGYPHNCYLQMAAETGLFGLISFLWIIFTIYKNSFKNLNVIQDPFLSCALLGFLAGLAGFLTQSFLDTNFYSVQLGALYWLSIGIIVAIQKIELKPIP